MGVRGSAVGRGLSPHTHLTQKIPHWSYMSIWMLVLGGREGGREERKKGDGEEEKKGKRGKERSSWRGEKEGKESVQYEVYKCRVQYYMRPSAIFRALY